MWEWMRGRPTRRLGALAAAVAAAFALGAPGVSALSALPDTISMTAGTQAVLGFTLPGSARLDAGDTRASINVGERGVEIEAGEASGTASLIFRLLGVLPVKTVAVEVAQQRVLIPGGQSVGIALETEGLVVVGTSDLGMRTSPAQRAGLRSGDVITEVNGVAVRTPEQLSAQLSARTPVTLTLTRNSKPRSVELTPEIDPRDGAIRLGAWVRSSTAGVGTLTYIDPETGAYGALGHAISDVDSGITLPVHEGALYESEIVQIRRGERGAPGEIVGDFFGAAREIGTVTQNGETGIYGSYHAADLSALAYPEGLPVGSYSQMHTGPAQLLSALDAQVRAFDCEIESIDPKGANATRAIVVRVTDEELIARTGGIVQGMSGSPLIQDGRIVGAVTHVFVNDPTRGYGIGIEAMLNAAPTAEVSAVHRRAA